MTSKKVFFNKFGLMSKKKDSTVHVQYIKQRKSLLFLAIFTQIFTKGKQFSLCQ